MLAPMWQTTPTSSISATNSSWMQLVVPIDRLYTGSAPPTPRRNAGPVRGASARSRARPRFLLTHRAESRATTRSGTRMADERNPSEDQCRQRDPPPPRSKLPAEADHGDDRTTARPDSGQRPTPVPSRRPRLTKCNFQSWPCPFHACFSDCTLSISKAETVL